ncbi:K(+)-transporting ATPase subunit F [Limnoraphis robusta Tam1]|uniref:K(+)-transporting ATPase subunit F n=1 Tax=Limnoraphis robusta CCNP1315 TaxID=3110306 RepID=A0ABU5TUN0_9CYAN|nr:K(+)-transporting ATPase subunit F [Limnoraphis robusta]MEA5498751.1 K(+)-transporting ATPase subunit F [Limnoraphis robusta BA-68 BA1]MEA5518346.1 K(+)-transporting ATPase subunit F [Limnoraphis robusta CCNP1315]MEA5542889.1 K(+)-transporting ATPase subunit F [Limnoraphis robusta Tam1]MEA5547727.1 K(+)-transporting ATPase subunit F [Limnoraphis robusta CCNP1324]
MKLNSFLETCDLIGSRFLHRKLSLSLFLALCFNVVLAPLVYAATNNNIAKSSAYALGLLGLVVIGLAVYLFVVILQPERF